MISVRTGIRPEEVRIEGQHVLFVEGKDQDAVDPKVLDTLFSRALRIEPLGPSFSVRSVAEALHHHHPTYYFLIDRDHYRHEFVEQCWTNFPDPRTHNLLVWRRREIENYFLEPQYLVRSRYCRVSEQRLGERILCFANQRLFLDVANQVVISIREDLKRNWIEKFSNPSDFVTKEGALLRLKNANEFDQHHQRVQRKVSAEEVECRFIYFLDKMTGGQKKIAFGAGEWIHLIQGKKVLAQVVNSECFQVVTTEQSTLMGRAKLNEVVKGLLQEAEAVQPKDFMVLKDLIDNRIGE